MSLQPLGKSGDKFIEVTSGQPETTEKLGARKNITSLIADTSKKVDDDLKANLAKLSSSSPPTESHEIKNADSVKKTQRNVIRDVTVKNVIGLNEEQRTALKQAAVDYTTGPRGIWNSMRNPELHQKALNIIELCDMKPITLYDSSTKTTKTFLVSPHIAENPTVGNVMYLWGDKTKTPYEISTFVPQINNTPVNSDTVNSLALNTLPHTQTTPAAEEKKPVEDKAASTKQTTEEEPTEAAAQTPSNELLASNLTDKEKADLYDKFSKGPVNLSATHLVDDNEPFGQLLMYSPEDVREALSNAKASANIQAEKNIIRSLESQIERSEKEIEDMKKASPEMNIELSNEVLSKWKSVLNQP